MASVVYFRLRTHIIFHILSSPGCRCGQQLVSPFYDAIQNALSGSSTTTASDLYGYILSFLILAMTYVLISIMTSFLLAIMCLGGARQ